MKRLIIVEGLPCSGKSTTARYIAEKLGYIYVDEGTCNHPADYHVCDDDCTARKFMENEIRNYRMWTNISEPHRSCT